MAGAAAVGGSNSSANSATGLSSAVISGASVAMACRPGNVDLSKAQGGCAITDIGHGFDSTGKFDIGFEDGGVEFPLLMKERWPLGYWDTSKPATEASEEHGERIMEVVRDYLARFATQFQTLPLDMKIDNAFYPHKP